MVYGPVFLYLVVSTVMPASRFRSSEYREVATVAAGAAAAGAVVAAGLAAAAAVGAGAAVGAATAGAVVAAGFGAAAAVVGAGAVAGVEQALTRRAPATIKEQVERSRMEE